MWGNEKLELVAGLLGVLVEHQAQKRSWNDSGLAAGGGALKKPWKPKGQPFVRKFWDCPPLKEGDAEQISQLRESLEVVVEGPLGKDIPPVQTFEELADILPLHISLALLEMGITAPLPVQSQALPIILNGHDLVGIAKTGSGKTLAFLMPAIAHIEAQADVAQGQANPIVLILAPTRELAVQIAGEATKLCAHSTEGAHSKGIKATCVYGGGDKWSQLAQLKNGSQILVATPGRLVDFLGNGSVSLHRVTYFVLDEADRMLEEGFASALTNIAEYIREDRHMLFFSATWPKAVQDLAKNLCHGFKKPVHIKIGQAAEGATTRSDIVQEIIVFDEATWEERDHNKQVMLYSHLKQVIEHPMHKVLVFVSRKDLADSLCKKLWKEGFQEIDAMHGGRSQDERLEALDKFRRSETRLLICTDVMSRGLDIPDVTHVVLYDMGEIEEYIHRIGRTARGPDGTGHALTFFEYNPKFPHLANELLQVLEQSGQEANPKLAELAANIASGNISFAKKKNVSDIQRALPTTPFMKEFLPEAPKLDDENQALIDHMRSLLEVRVEGLQAAGIEPIQSFSDLGVLPDYVQSNLLENGISAPLPIQAQAMPIILRGHDMIGIAKTGSGKTLAFLLPAIVHIEAQEDVPQYSATPIAIVLAPTRELAVQIKDEANKVLANSSSNLRPRGLGAAAVYGGDQNRIETLTLVQNGCHILVATPGRLCDHIEKGEIALDRVTYFVLDEADRMLEEGFGDQVNHINQRVRKDRQMLFFSATWPEAVKSLAANMCRGAVRPVRLAVGQHDGDGVTTRTDIQQTVMVFDQPDWDSRDAAKQKVLYGHLRRLIQDEQHKVLVFVNRKELADELATQLTNEGFYTAAMHGGKKQTRRLAILDEFRQGATRLLVATDVMGRGLDIPDITHVIIYDMCEIEDYVHRIGRTARGPDGKGHAMTLFEYDAGWPTQAAGLIQVLEEAGQEVPAMLRKIAREVETGTREVREKPLGFKNKTRSDKKKKWEKAENNDWQTGDGSSWQSAAAPQDSMQKMAELVAQMLGGSQGNGWASSSRRW